MSIETQPGTVQVLSVTLGGQMFGIEIDAITDIIPHIPDTPVPQAGPNISGLMNLRGHIVTCINVRHCLGFTDKDDGNGNSADRMDIVVRHGAELYGLRFETAQDIRTLDLTAREAVPSILAERWRGLSKGLFRQNDGLLILLDADLIIEAAGVLPTIRVRDRA
jgi:purine-binding chemotaxis protein CheW